MRFKNTSSNYNNSLWRKKNLHFSFQFALRENELFRAKYTLKRSFMNTQRERERNKGPIVCKSRTEWKAISLRHNMNVNRKRRAAIGFNKIFWLNIWHIDLSLSLLFSIYTKYCSSSAPRVLKGILFFFQSRFHSFKQRQSNIHKEVELVGWAMKINKSIEISHHYHFWHARTFFPA